MGNPRSKIKSTAANSDVSRMGMDSKYGNPDSNTLLNSASSTNTPAPLAKGTEVGDRKDAEIARRNGVATPTSTSPTKQPAAANAAFDAKDSKHLTSVKTQYPLLSQQFKDANDFVEKAGKSTNAIVTALIQEEVSKNALPSYRQKYLEDMQTFLQENSVETVLKNAKADEAASIKLALKLTLQDLGVKFEEKNKEDKPSASHKLR